VALSERVAEAAEAWLADPRDPQVYGRLLLAVRVRRDHLDGRPDAAGDVDAEAVAEAAASEPGEVGGPDGAASLESPDSLAARRPVQAVGAAWRGADPRELLERLRRGE